MVVHQLATESVAAPAPAVPLPDRDPIAEPVPEVVDIQTKANDPVIRPVAPLPSNPVSEPTVHSDELSPRRKPVRTFVPCTIPAFTERMDEDGDLTWLFTGDSLSQRNGQLARGGTFPSYVERLVRDRLGRVRDAFITTAVPDFFLRDLSNNFSHRVSRFSPDVVVLMFGASELRDTTEDAFAFERRFHQLVHRLRAMGAVTIVNMPPYPLNSESDSSVEQLVKIEAIRNATVESSALLVDHWTYWQESATPEWFRSDGCNPSERGVIEMSRLFVKVFSMDELWKSTEEKAESQPQAKRRPQTVTEGS